MRLRRVLCVLNNHRPVREGVEWNGHHLHGMCKFCHTPIYRLERGGWRRSKNMNQNAFIKY